MKTAWMAALALTWTLIAHSPAQEPKPKPATPAVQNVTPEQAQKLVQEKKEIVVLDVRTPEEFQAGHIAGAQNLNLMSDDFKQKLAALDKTKEYVVHCASGTRSARAVKQMEQQEFSHVYHLNGGMKAWEGAGQPVEK